jgi:hypothetical protein
MFVQVCVVLVTAPEELLVEDDPVVVVVVAAKEANPKAASVPTAKIAMTAMRSIDLFIGKDRVLGKDEFPISIFSFTSKVS